MVDYGFSGEEGDKKKLYTLIDRCDIGENCGFNCLSDKCVARKSDGDQRGFVKHLVKKEGDCYWFEGNEDKKTSWDSRWYGWLCGNELEILGVYK